jgi:hypothetical protein
MFGERFHAERFCRVVAAVENVDSKILGERKGPVRAFAGDESIHTFPRGDFHFGSGSAGDDSDFAAARWTARENFGRSSSCFFKMAGEFVAIEVHVSADAQVAAFLEEKRLEFTNAQRPREERVVAESQMRVERQMGRINGHVGFDQRLD